MALSEILIDDFIKNLNLPSNSKFLGYVIHLPNEDEFLHKITETKSVTKRYFAQTPEAAKIYKDHKQAIKDSKQCKQETIVCILFDVGKQLAVIPIGE